MSKVPDTQQLAVAQAGAQADASSAKPWTETKGMAGLQSILWIPSNIESFADDAMVGCALIACGLISPNEKVGLRACNAPWDSKFGLPDGDSKQVKAGLSMRSRSAFFLAISHVLKYKKIPAYDPNLSGTWARGIATCAHIVARRLWHRDDHIRGQPMKFSQIALGAPWGDGAAEQMKLWRLIERALKYVNFDVQDGSWLISLEQMKGKIISRTPFAMKEGFFSRDEINFFNHRHSKEIQAYKDFEDSINKHDPELLRTVFDEAARLKRETEEARSILEAVVATRIRALSTVRLSKKKNTAALLEEKKQLIDADVYAKAYNPILLIRKNPWSFRLDEILDGRGKVVPDECKKLKSEFNTWLTGVSQQDAEIAQIIGSWFNQELYPRMTGGQ